MRITCDRPWLVASFASPQRMVSWSMTRPGFVDATTVAWREVGGEELAPDLDADAWFRRALAERGLPDAVGMMTARDVEKHHRQTCLIEGVTADCLVTVGLRNGERIGRRAGVRPAMAAGTINMLCHVDVPLSDAALLEASSIATQARTVALVEAGYRREAVEGIVTGTGTDCIVMSAPPGARRAAFAGMHTAVGEAVGACVLAATRAAATAWIEQQAG